MLCTKTVIRRQTGAESQDCLRSDSTEADLFKKYFLSYQNISIMPFPFINFPPVALKFVS